MTEPCSVLATTHFGYHRLLRSFPRFCEVALDECLLVEVCTPNSPYLLGHPLKEYRQAFLLQAMAYNNTR